VAINRRNWSYVVVRNDDSGQEDDILGEQLRLPRSEYVLG
jgi:hypothetical protein